MHAAPPPRFCAFFFVLSAAATCFSTPDVPLQCASLSFFLSFFFFFFFNLFIHSSVLMQQSSRLFFQFSFDLGEGINQFIYLSLKVDTENREKRENTRR